MVLKRKLAIDGKSTRFNGSSLHIYIYNCEESTFKTEHEVLLSTHSLMLCDNEQLASSPGEASHIFFRPDITVLSRLSGSRSISVQ